MKDAKAAYRPFVRPVIGDAGTGTLTTGYTGAIIRDDATGTILYVCHHAPHSGYEVFHALMADLQDEGGQVNWHRPITVELRMPRG